MRALTLALLWLVASPSVAAPATTLSTEPTVTTAATDSGDLKDAICIPFIGCI